MKSDKFIEWEDYFCLGHTLIRIAPCKYQAYTIDSYKYEAITFNYQFNVAPKNMDAAIHKANRLFKYYTFKEYPGAVKFLGCK